jgi:hypothetical protein
LPGTVDQRLLRRQNLLLGDVLIFTADFGTIPSSADTPYRAGFLATAFETLENHSRPVLRALRAAT